MTAGQRNCLLAIEECLHRYGRDDVMTALNELLPDEVAQVVNAERERCIEICRDIANAYAACSPKRDGVYLAAKMIREGR